MTDIDLALLLCIWVICWPHVFFGTAATLIYLGLIND